VSVDEEIDGLYGLPLDDFVAKRNALAGRLRKAGERDEAERVKALAKPSVSAWVVNQLARQERMQMRSLLTAGERLRKAQEELLRGGTQKELQEAAARQRDVVAALVESAAEVLRSAGRPATEAVLERVRATLVAAAGDEEGRQLVQAGRLTEDLDPTGFGPLATAGAGARKEAAARTKKREKARREVDALRAELDERRTSARKARAEADKAARAAEAAEKAAVNEEKALEEVRRRLEAAKEALGRER
jgi:hypothetical protein